MTLYEKYKQILERVRSEERPDEWLRCCDNEEFSSMARLKDLFKEQLLSLVDRKKNQNFFDKLVLCCVKMCMLAQKENATQIELVFREMYQATPPELRSQNAFFFAWWTKAALNADKSNDAIKICTKGAQIESRIQQKMVEYGKRLNKGESLGDIPVPPELQQTNIPKTDNHERRGKEGGAQLMEQEEVRHQMKQLTLSQTSAPGRSDTPTTEKKTNTDDVVGKELMESLATHFHQIVQNALGEFSQRMELVIHDEISKSTKKMEEIHTEMNRMNQVLERIENAQNGCLPNKRRKNAEAETVCETTEYIKAPGLSFLQKTSDRTNIVSKHANDKDVATGTISKPSYPGGTLEIQPMEDSEIAADQTVKSSKVGNSSAWNDPENCIPMETRTGGGGFASDRQGEHQGLSVKPKRVFGPRGTIDDIRALKAMDCNSDSTPDTSPRVSEVFIASNRPSGGMATSTPFEKNGGDKKSMPMLNVSVINRCSLSTVAEVEHEESQGSRVAHESSSKQGRSNSTSSLNGGGGASEGSGIDDSLKLVADPFSDDSIQLYFRKLKLPESGEGLPKLRKFSKLVPDWVPGREMNCGLSCSFIAGDYVDSGKFGRVFKIKDAGGDYAAKIQKPPFPWEFYVLQLLIKKLKNLNLAFDITLNIQEPRAFYSFSDGGILVSKFYNAPTMLHFQNNLARQKIQLSELELIILLIELILIVENMHKCEIIHADLKPDNIIMRAPSRLPQNRKEFFTNELCFMVLIDFGKGIDMTMFPKNHKFTSEDAASNFTCTQMKDKKPWSYELDIFCIAATIHVLMFGKYMSNVTKDKISGLYRLNETPKRDFKRELWNEFYGTALNAPYKTATLPTMRDDFTDHLFVKYSDGEIKNAFYNLNKHICRL